MRATRWHLAGDFAGQIELLQEVREALTLGLQAELAGQAEGIDQTRLVRFEQVSTEEAPVDGDVAADDVVAVDTVGDLAGHVDQRRAPARAAFVRPGETTGVGDRTAGIDQRLIRMIDTRLAAEDWHERDLKDHFMDAVLGACSFLVEGNKIGLIPGDRGGWPVIGHVLRSEGS